VRVLLCSLFASVVMQAQSPWDEPEVAKAFKGLDYVLLVKEEGPCLRRGRLNPDERLAPCSTFKLPHALIALERGVIKLEENLLTCDPKECHHPHDTLGLEKAIRESCVSYFRQVARRIGVEGERAGIKALGYPATGALKPADLFWLEGPTFGISPMEQLSWIHRFYTEDLGVKPAHLQAVRAATRRTETSAWTLYGKTGSSRLLHGQAYGWFVGQVKWKSGRVSDVVVLVKATKGGFLGLMAQEALEHLLMQETQPKARL
jgi:beta-lactamase class D